MSLLSFFTSLQDVQDASCTLTIFVSFFLHSSRLSVYLSIFTALTLESTRNEEIFKDR